MITMFDREGRPDRACPDPRSSDLRRLATGLLVVIFCIAIAGCGASSKIKHPPRGKEYFPESQYGKASPRVVSYGKPVPKGGGRYHVGKPYKIAGKWYRPKENPNYKATGIASWYGSAFHGRKTANGEIYDMGALTAAHPTLPLPSYVRVTNLHNSRSVVVRVNDRGPFAHGRVIDLSQRAAELLDYKKRGTAKVRVEYVGKARMDGLDQEYLMASLTVNGRPVNGGPRTPGEDSAAPTIMVADASSVPPGMERSRSGIGYSQAPPAPAPRTVEPADLPPLDAGAPTQIAELPAPRTRPLAGGGTPLDIRPQSLSANMRTGATTTSGSAPSSLDTDAWGSLAVSPEITGSIGKKKKPIFGHPVPFRTTSPSRSYAAASRVAAAHHVIDRLVDAETGTTAKPAAKNAGRISPMILQAAVFADAANAERARKTLAGLGEVTVATLDRGAAPLHVVRVRLGERIAAAKAVGLARANGFNGAYILR